MEHLLQDFRFAVRRLRQSPGFTLAAVVTLALGIGANATIFTLVNAVLFRPLPVADPQRLVFLNNGENTNFSYPQFRDFRDRNNVLAGLTTERVMPMNVSIQNGNNTRIWGLEAAGNYFDLLGIQPLAGRLFHPADDDKPGAHPVVVLSYRFWQKSFHGDANIAGKTVKINGLNYTVVGVTPAGFTGAEQIFLPDMWVPMTMEAQIEPGNDWMNRRQMNGIWVIGRLKPGVAVQQAETALNGIAAQLAHEHPDTDEGMKIELSPPGLVGNGLRKPVLAFSLVLMAIAGLVLWLACLNLAGMLLARASDRRKEIAVRLALGAGRMQLIRQLLIESLVLALTAGSAGFLLSLWLSDLCASISVSLDVPLNMVLTADYRVVLFTFAAALFATLMFGLIPALQTTRAELVPALKNESTTERGRSWHLRDFLVAGQIALSVVLLISSVLVIRSLQHALSMNLGFNPHGAVSISFDASLDGYSDQRGSALEKQVLAKAEALPGMIAVGSINNMPLRLGIDMSGISIEGKPVPPPSKMESAIKYSITPGYLQAAGTRLMSGRNFDLHDSPDSPQVALVNETFVRRLLPGESALGKRFRLGRDSGLPWIQIVGVVEGGKYESLGEDPTLAVFQPLAQRYDSNMTLVARTALPPAEAIRALRQVTMDADATLTLYNVGSLEDQLSLPMFPARVAASVLGAFGGIAMVLASTGVFALMAYSVSRRTREIGIRMALGAQTGDVLDLVLRRTFAIWLAGSVAGTGIALVAGGLLSAILYGVSSRDPLTYVLALSLMAAIAASACWHPVRRAMRIDPSSALREE